MNLTIRLSAITSVLLFALLSSCVKDLGVEPSGKIITDYRSLASFDGVTSDGDYDVYITQSNSAPTVEIDADANFVPYISTVVTNNGTLIVKNINNHYFKGGERVKIYVTVPYIEYIELAGSGYMTCDDATNDVMTANISGSGTISMVNLDTKEFDVNISGSGSLDVDGIADVAHLDIPGSGTITGYAAGRASLAIGDCYINIAGVGNAYVNVGNKLDVTVDGKGRIYYIGHPGKIVYDMPGDGGIYEKN